MFNHIAKDVFVEPLHREYWIALLGVESGFKSSAVSNTGAIGLGQLIATYADDFGKPCGIGDLTKADLKDNYTNAYLSACYFRSLIKANNGSIPLALIAYNAGPNSKDLKAAKRGVAPGQEPSAHATKVWVKKNQIKGK